MALVIQKLYGSTGTIGSNAAIASADVPADGEITAVTWAIDTVDAAGACGQVELSLSSASGITTNDTRSSITGAAYNNTVANAPDSRTHHVTFDPPFQVMGGDRLYLHNNNVAAFDTLRISCYIHLNTKAAAGRTRRL